MDGKTLPMERSVAGRAQTGPEYHWSGPLDGPARVRAGFFRGVGSIQRKEISLVLHRKVCRQGKISDMLRNSYESGCIGRKRRSTIRNCGQEKKRKP